MANYLWLQHLLYKADHTNVMHWLDRTFLKAICSIFTCFNYSYSDVKSIQYILYTSQDCRHISQMHFFFFFLWIEFFIRKNAIVYRSQFMRILPKHNNKLALKKNTMMTENSKYCTFEEPATRLIENQHTTPTTPHTSMNRLYK